MTWWKEVRESIQTIPSCIAFDGSCKNGFRLCIVARTSRPEVGWKMYKFVKL